jgi:hypothetical protein
MISFLRALAGGGESPPSYTGTTNGQATTVDMWSRSTCQFFAYAGSSRWMV